MLLVRVESEAACSAMYAKSMFTLLTLAFASGLAIAVLSGPHTLWMQEGSRPKQESQAVSNEFPTNESPVQYCPTNAPCYTGNAYQSRHTSYYPPYAVNHPLHASHYPGQPQSYMRASLTGYPSHYSAGIAVQHAEYRDQPVPVSGISTVEVPPREGASPAQQAGLGQSGLGSPARSEVDHLHGEAEYAGSYYMATVARKPGVYTTS